MTKGYVVAIGGAESRVKHPTILSEFVRLCGGKNAHIAVIPTASRLGDTASGYQQLFAELGAGKIDALDILRRRDCEKQEYLDILDEVDGVFMTGGDQLRLATIVGGTSVSKKLLSCHSTGTHIAGTSAGAAFISEHMIAGGKSGDMPRSDMVRLATGLGLNRHLIIDQHFRQRHRMGRLMGAVTYNPSAIGVGVDENTAAFIDPDNRIKVMGVGWVTVIDPHDMETSNIDSAKKSQMLSLSNLKVHMLVSGDVYDINSRQVTLAGGD